MLDQEQHLTFSKLWSNVQPEVTAYVRAIIRDSHATTEIVQNTAVKTLSKFESWDSQRAFLPWVLGFAKFEILAHHRDSARGRIVLDNELLNAVTEVWPSVSLEIHAEKDALKECLQLLKPTERELVHLRYYEDFNAPQIAERMESTTGAVRVALMRVRRQLHDCVSRRLKNLRGEV